MKIENKCSELGNRN